jgi:hypothetical protein
MMFASLKSAVKSICWIAEALIVRIERDYPMPDGFVPMTGLEHKVIPQLEISFAVYFKHLRCTFMEKLNGLPLHATEVSIENQRARNFEAATLSTRLDASATWSIASSPIAVAF